VRSFHKTPVLYDQVGVRAAHKTLRQGGLVAFLADQRPPTQGESGTWLGQPTQVSPLPRRWCQGLEPEIWTGHLIPGPAQYRLTLERFSSEVIQDWDRVLDQTFLPLVHQSPEWHFGLFHNRLVPRGTSRHKE
jgi:lauroyl/myristoyl acyltransferase